MKQKHKMAYINVITTVLCAVVIFAGAVWSFCLLRSVEVRYYDNQARTLLNDTMKEIEAGKTAVCQFPYIVFGTDGQVHYADEEFEVAAGDTVNVQEMLQTDEYFAAKHAGQNKRTFTLNTGSVVTGFVVFLLPEDILMEGTIKEQISKDLIPAGAAVVIVILLQMAMSLLYNRRVFRPLREISTSANHIIAGNYDYEVLRVSGKTVRDDEMGDLVYSFELMRDELKEKQLKEEQLKKSQQELISCISHDLKTPISTIKAYGEGLRDGIAQTEETRREYEEIIINKTNTLNQMISELLEYSNAQLNQLEIVPKEIYFLSYFEEVARELQGYAKQRGVVLTYQTDLTDMIVTIDCRRVTEVLYNLIENSIKYIGEQAGKIKLIAVAEDQRVLIRVIDNGIGINADDIPYVFDKFYRAEKSRTSSIPGSGLGLSICKYIIETLGGTIYCKSSQGQGCEIGFTLC